MKRAGRKAADTSVDNRQLIWDALRASVGEWVTIQSLSEELKVNRKTALDYLDALEAAELVARRRDEGQHGLAWVRLLREGGYHAPRLRKDGTAVTQGVGVINMWRSMRILKVFTAPEIAQISSTPTVSVTDFTAQSYIGMLFATGFLAVVEKANPALGRKASYRLVRNEGPKPPMIQRVKQVYDPNTGTVHVKVERA
jgi:DNA-binding MarR family transcriptional regulator